MAEVGENFRKAYYANLRFREEVASTDLSQIESLLKVDVIDVPRVRSFCLEHTVPIFYRRLVWMLLLGIEPAHRDDDTRRFVWAQRQEQYEELKRAFLVMNGYTQSELSSATTASLDPSTYTCSVGDFSEMYFIERSTPSVFNTTHLSATAALVLDMFEDEMEAYFVFSRFCSLWEQAVNHHDAMLAEFSTSLAQTDRLVFQHLQSLSAFSSIPVQRWITTCFAGILSYPELENVWDKVMSGSWMVVVYVAVAVVVSHSRRLMKLRSCQQILQLMENLPMDNVASIVQKGLDIWENNGCPMQISTMRRTR